MPAPDDAQPAAASDARAVHLGALAVCLLVLVDQAVTAPSDGDAFALLSGGMAVAVLGARARAQGVPARGSLGLLGSAGLVGAAALGPGGSALTFTLGLGAAAGTDPHRPVGVRPSLRGPLLWGALLGAAVGLIAVETGVAPAAFAPGPLRTVLLALTPLTACVALCRKILADRATQRIGEEGERVERAAQRARAHWIHDRVLADLHGARTRLPTQPDQAAHLLTLLEEDLRADQLDALMQAGPVSVAAVLQRHLRRATDRGLTLTEVPSAEQVAGRLDRVQAALVDRVLSGLISNALNAGARHLAVRIDHEAGGLQIEVRDDATGDAPTSAPPLTAGRGLDMLNEELGADAVRITPSTAGTTVVVRVPFGVLRGRTRDGADPAGR